ncbi:MAG: hypothetical protein ACREOQ_13280 [Gemmatimonadales bacterium]
MQVAGSRTRLAQLFRNTRRAHHHALATSGGDAAWPAWYAAYLSPRLGELIPVPPSMDRLAADLVIVDRIYRQASAVLAWPEYYVEWFMQRYGAPKASIAAL